jgi:hypothetical protein
MAGIAHGMKPTSGHGPSIAVAREFVQADQAKKKGARSRDQKTDRKRRLNDWAAGKGPAT